MDEKEIYGQKYYQKIYSPSFLDKLKEKINILKLSGQEVKAMKKLLIVEAKPIFLESTKDIFLENLFDERIETLSKGSIYQLYNLFIDYKNLIGTKYEDFARSLFQNDVNLEQS